MNVVQKMIKKMKDKYLEFYKTNFGTAKYCTKSWGLASFEAGAQSRQAEIDGLRERIDNLTNINESLVAYKNQLLDDIDEKGNKDEN